MLDTTLDNLPPSTTINIGMATRLPKHAMLAMGESSILDAEGGCDGRLIAEASANMNTS